MMDASRGNHRSRTPKKLEVEEHPRFGTSSNQKAASNASRSQTTKVVSSKVSDVRILHSPGKTTNQKSTPSVTPTEDRVRLEDRDRSASVDDLVMSKLCHLAKICETGQANTQSFDAVMHKLEQKLQPLQSKDVVDRLEPRALFGLLQKVRQESQNFLKSVSKVNWELKEQIEVFQKDYNMALFLPSTSSIRDQRRGTSAADHYSFDTKSVLGRVHLTPLLEETLQSAGREMNRKLEVFESRLSNGTLSLETRIAGLSRAVKTLGTIAVSKQTEAARLQRELQVCRKDSEKMKGQLAAQRTTMHNQDLADSLKQKVRLMEDLISSLQSENAKLLDEASSQQQNHDQLLQIDRVKFENRVLLLEKALAMESSECAHSRHQNQKLKIELEKSKSLEAQALEQLGILNKLHQSLLDTTSKVPLFTVRVLPHLTLKGINPKLPQEQIIVTKSEKQTLTDQIEPNKRTVSEKSVSDLRRNDVGHHKSTSVDGFAELRRKHDDLTQTYRALQQELEQVSTQNSTLIDQQKKLQLAHQQAQRDSQRNQLESGDRIKQLKMELETRVGTSERDAKSNQDLFAQITSLQNKVDSLLQENTGLQTKNALLTQQNSQLSNERIVAEIELNKRLNELEGKVRLREREVQDERIKVSDLERIRRDLTNQVEKLTSVQSELDQKHQELLMAHEQIDQLRSAHQKAEQAHEASTEQSQQTIQELKNDVQILESQLQSANLSLATQDDHNRQLMRTTQTLTEQLSQLQSKLGAQSLTASKNKPINYKELAASLEGRLDSLVSPLQRSLLAKVDHLTGRLSQLQTVQNRLQQAARAKIAALKSQIPAVPMLAGGMDYMAFLELKSENKTLKELVRKVEAAADDKTRSFSSKQTQEVDRLSNENQFLKDQIRAFVEEMAEISGANVQLNDEIEKLNQRGADDRERVVAMKSLLKKVVKQSQDLAEDVHKMQTIPKIPLGSALLSQSDITQVERETGLNGKKMLIDAVIEAKRLRSVVGLLERETTKLNSRVDSLQRQLKRSKDEKLMFVEANEKVVSSMKEKEEELKYLRHCLDIAAKGRIDAAQEDFLRQVRKENEDVKAQMATLKRELILSNKERSAQVTTLNSLGAKKDFLSDLVRRLAEKFEKSIAKQFEDVLRRIDYKDDFSDDYSALVYLLESHRVDETLKNKKEELEAKLRLLKVENQKYLQALQSQRLSQGIMSQRLMESRSQAKGLNYIPTIMALGEEIERGNIQETKNVLEALLRMGNFGQEKLESIMHRLNGLLD